MSEHNEQQVRPSMSGAARRIAEEMAAKQVAEAKRRRTAWLGSGIAVLVVAGAVVGLIALNSDNSKPGSPTVEAPSAAAPSATPTAAAADQPKVTAGTGAAPTTLQVKVLKEGSGPVVKSGQTITVNYVGVTYKDGKEFDSSWKRGEPASFAIGVGQVIKGWDQGLVGQKVGSRVQLDIPAGLAYGENPGGGRPAGALRFVVDIISAQ